MKKILIPIAKSFEEKIVIDEAVELAKKFDSEITLLNVDNSKEILRNINSSSLVDDGRLARDINRDAFESETGIPTGIKARVSKKNNQRQHEEFNETIFLDQANQSYKNEGVETKTLLLTGDPASVIIDEAESGNYDLVIMKTHTMKERKRFMMGSVTNKVVHHIKTPILIIR